MPQQPYNPDYYKKHKKEYLESCKTYYEGNKQKYKDRYKKNLGCVMTKPYFSIDYYPEGICPFAEK
jgi:hypothetical protein